VKSVELCEVGMKFDGIDFFGVALRIRRPNDYNAAAAAAIPRRPEPPLHLDRLEIVSTDVPEGPEKVFLGGLPYHLTTAQVKELLVPFGKLRSFNLIKQINAVSNKGYCFFEFRDPSITDGAMAALRGIELGGGPLTAMRTADTQRMEEIQRRMNISIPTPREPGPRPPPPAAAMAAAAAAAAAVSAQAAAAASQQNGPRPPPGPPPGPRPPPGPPPGPRPPPGAPPGWSGVISRGPAPPARPPPPPPSHPMGSHWRR